MMQEHDEKYKNLLKNKTIAIVGPANSVKHEGNREIIESCDLVVRINQGIEMIEGNREYIGERTDILYNSLDFDRLSGGNIFDMKLENIKFICCPYSYLEKTYNNVIFIKNNNTSLFEKYNIRFIDNLIYEEVKNKTNSRVNSGLGSIVDLLSFDIKFLYVTGIDFYRSFYSSDYCAARNRQQTIKNLEDELEFKKFDDKNHHNPDRQYLFFKQLVEKNDKIKIDNFMKKIINDERYDRWDTIPRG